MTTNDIAKIRKPQTRLKRTQINLPSDCTEKKRTTVCRGKRTLFLHLQLILAFISSKYVFPYKVYKSYTELGLAVILRDSFCRVILSTFCENRESGGDEHFRAEESAVCNRSEVIAKFSPASS